VIKSRNKRLAGHVACLTETTNVNLSRHFVENVTEQTTTLWT